MSALKPIGTPFIELPSIDSTNNYAMGLVHAGMAQHGTAVFTHEQTKGKGQLNKVWISEKDKNIALSIILEPENRQVSALFLLSMAVATAVHGFLNSYTKGEVKIKWPNDIYWRDRKAGGILIENVLNGTSWKYAIAGIGLNINQTSFDDLKSKAVSLKQITGQTHSPLLLAQELCHWLDKAYKDFEANPEQVAEQYRSELYKLNEKVKFKRHNQVVEAVVKDVTNSGHLLIQHQVQEQLKVGEVEWII